MTKKICLILDGTLVDKAKNKVEGESLTVLFENELVSQKEYKIKNSLTSEIGCIIAEADYEQFNDILGGLKNAKIASKKFTAIDNINIFKDLSEDKKEKIEKNLKLEKFNNGKKIISQGQVGNKLYIIKKGRVDLFLNSKYIKSAQKGEDFGSKFLFLKNAKYLMTIIANGYVECYTLSADICKSILDENLMEYFRKKYHFNDFSIELKDLEFIKELGKGSYGQVNLVKNKKKGQYYAIKSLNINQVKSENMEQNVEQEKSIVLKLDHPFIAKMVKYIKNDKNIFFIIEYVHGKDLWDVMRMIGLCNNYQTQFYGASMLVVADYLHKLKIIHRDIKPENVMIDDKGYVKFIDFGSAKEIKDRTNTIIGTTLYMAPEILEGSSYSFQVDMWSIAVCMYELMCGHVPFGDDIEDDPQLFYQYIMKGDVSFPSFINDENFMNLMHKMLAKEQNKRLYKLEDIKKHPYFKDFDWEKLVTFSLDAPYSLKLNDDYKKQQNTIPYLTYLNNESNKKGNKLAFKRLNTKREINFKTWLNNF
jgi:cGMP-dependent protein kinase